MLNTFSITLIHFEYDEAKFGQIGQNSAICLGGVVAGAMGAAVCYGLGQLAGGCRGLDSFGGKFYRLVLVASPIGYRQ